MPYRFPKWKDASWNSFDRQRERYELIRPHLGFDLVGAEIGVYKGGFGEFLLDHCKKLYLVDPWFRAGGFWHTEIPNDSRVTTVIDILSIYKTEIEMGKVEVIIDYSENFFRSISDYYFDFIYVDSSHIYENTLREIMLAHSKLKGGGYLFGDDYDPNPQSKQHGVFRAVNDYVARTGARMILNSGRQWGLLFS
jgi:hypothetical protein